MTKQKPTKIAFFGHFGSMNSGNEATLRAIVSRVRTLLPDCDLSCICTYPEKVIATHGIGALPYTVRSVRIWNRGERLFKRIRTAPLGVLEELGEYLRAWRALKGTDMFVIPGTGVLTDAWGLSNWGPYGLFKWSLMARLRGARVVFVSVGVGPLHSRRGRFLARAALSLADYRSYRDAPSKETVRSLGVRASADPVYPDLVFGLSLPSARPTRVRAERRPVVGLGLMEYAEKYSSDTPMRHTYGRYLTSLADFAHWLLDHGYDVKLLLGDGDTFVIDDFRAVLHERLPPDAVGRVTDHPIDSVDELLSQIGMTDLVVATRFHNVLMSLLLGKPVVAISFHHKCSSLMSEMGLSDYCHDIRQVNADALVEQFEALTRNSDDVERTIAEGVDRCRLALDEQYQLLFGVLVDQERSVRTATVAT